MFDYDGYIMKTPTTTKQAAALGVAERAARFGVEAKDEKWLVPLAVLMLGALAFTALTVAAAGALILIACAAMRSAALQWLSRQHLADRAARNANRRVSAERAKALAGKAAQDTKAAASISENNLLPRPPALKGGRSIPHVGLTPKFATIPNARAVAARAVTA